MIVTEKNKTVAASALSAQDLQLINRYTRRELTPQELYTFRVILCDNEIDRDYERFSIAALQKLAQLFTGKTGIYDHNPTAAGQTARIYKTEIHTDETRRTAAGEPYTALCAYAYMPRTEKNSALIQEIDSGIKKEVSVGCAVAQSSCSICGKKAGECLHRAGESYDGKQCSFILSDPTDAYEWSFVAVPAQRGAGVVKQYMPGQPHDDLGDVTQKLKEAGAQGCHFSAQEAALLQEKLCALQAGAKEGEAYRKSICDEIVRCGAVLCPGLGTEVLRKSTCGLSLQELLQLQAAYRQGANRHLPLTPQLACAGKAEKNGNREFQI